MVDVSGLNYTIVVKDEFSTTTEKFRAELLASSAAFKSFSQQGTDLAQQTKSLRNTAAAAKSLTKASKELTEEQKRALGTNGRVRDINLDVTRAFLSAARAREIQRLAEERGLDLSRKTVKVLSVEEAALKKLAKAQRDASIATRARVLTADKTQGPKISDLEAAALKKVARALDTKAVAARASQIADERGITIGKEKVAQLTIEEEAIARVAAAERKLAIATRAAQIAQDKQVGPRLPGGQFLSGGGGLVPNKEIVEKNKLLQLFNRHLAETGKQGNSLLFTFRRLFGVLALFQAARLAARSFFNTIKEGITFNAEVQTATLGIASIVTAVADLRDEFGRTLKPAQALAASQIIAQKEVAKLRQEAFKTTASFEELLDAFQVAIAPGLTSGLKLGEVREFSVRISQAAQALGLAQNQLSEEIRSILSGTIQARTTRIATALGITNEDIRRAKEAGTLFKFLQDRFKAFEAAGEKAARGTFLGLFNLIKNTFTLSLGKAAEGAFQDLIKLGNILLDRVLTVRNAMGEIEPNPQLVDAFKQVFDVLKDLLQTAINTAKEIGFEGATKGAKGFAEVLRLVGEVIIGAFAGIAKTIIAVVATVKTIAEALGVSNVAVASFLGSATALIVSLGFVLRIVTSIGFQVFRIITHVAKLPGLLGVSGQATAALGGVLSGVLGVVTLLGVGFKLLAEHIFDVNLTIGETIELFGLNMAQTFQTIIATIEEAFAHIKNFFTNALQEAETFGEKIGRTARIGAAALLGDFEEVNRLRELQSKKDDSREEKARKDKLAFEDKIAQIREKNTLTQVALNEKIAGIVADAAAREAQGPGFDPKAFNFDQFLKPTEINKDLEEGNVTLSTAKSLAANLADELKSVADEARKIRLEFDAAFGRPLLQGAAGQIEAAFQAAFVTAKEKTTEISTQIATVQDSLRSLQQEQLTLPAPDSTAPFSLETFERAREVQATINSLLADEKLLLQARQQLERDILSIAISRAAVIAQQEVPALNLENQTLQQRLVAEQAIARATQQRATDSQLAVLQAQLELKAVKEANESRLSGIQAELSALKEKAQFADLQLTTQVTFGDFDGAARTSLEKTALDDLIGAKATQLDLEQQVAAVQEDQLAFLLEQANLVQNGNITEGIREGLIQLASELPTFFEAGINIVKSAVTSFTSTISSTVAALFDPTQNVSLAEAAGRFFLNLGQTILQNILDAFIQNLITTQLGLGLEKAVPDPNTIALQSAAVTLGTSSITLGTSATTLGAATVGLGTGAAALGTAAATTAVSAAALLAAAQAMIIANSIGFGKAQGGLVGLGRAAGGIISHRQAAGMKIGGRVRNAPTRFMRPKGLNPTDVVPLWAAPGEFMQRAAAVRKYGLRTMEALNRGLIDPGALDALTPSSRTVSARRSPGIGMAQGGLVSDRQRQAAASARPTTDRPTPAYVVPSEQSFERQLAKGKTPMLRFLEENSGAVNAALRRR